MNRRAWLLALAAGGGGLAGCSGTRGSEDRDDDTPTEAATETTAPPTVSATDLELDGTLVIEGESRETSFHVDADVRNPTEQTITAELNAAVVPLEDDVPMPSRTVDATVPPGNGGEVRIDLMELSSLGWEQLTACYFKGIEVDLRVGDELRPLACPDLPVVADTSEACRFPFGLVETFVEIEASDNWSGRLVVDGERRGMSRSLLPFGAPEGYERSYANVDDGASEIIAAAEKTDGGGEGATVRIVHRGEVVAEDTASATYGTASARVDL